MDRDELAALYVMATKARNLAHEAYGIALRNRQADGDTVAAYQTLLQANRVRNQIYSALIALTGR